VASAGFRCSLDDAPFAACSSPQPFHALAPRPHTFAARAVDAAGNADASPATRTWTVDPAVDGSGGLLPNGSFERSTGGWTAGNGSVAVAGGGKLGLSAARVSWAAGEDFFFGALSPPPVPVAAASPYQVAGWVRSETGGEYVCLVLREWDGPVYVRQALQCLTATTDWQAWPPVALLTPAAGHQLDVYTIALNAKPGDSYDVDGLTLTAG